MNRTVTFLACALACTTPALASGAGDKSHGGTAYLANGALTYEVFETAIEHVDLETCPADFDSDANFCRMTLAADLAHVFVFSYAGDLPLLAVKSYALGDGFLPF